LHPANIITREIAERQLALFRLAVRGRLADSIIVDDGQEDELWSVGQHHGLQTPLLDWTYSPYVALFFAFEKPDLEHESDNPYRAMYVLNKSVIASDDICPHIRVLEPRRDEYGRLVNQAGLFTFSPYDETIEGYLINSLSETDSLDVDLDDPNELANYICKIYVANEDRDGCLKHLRRMNVHHASLFPDLIGACSYCNIQINEESILSSSANLTVSQSFQASHGSEALPIAADNSDSQESILAILQQNPTSTSVEQGRLEAIALDLSNSLSKLLVVDWEDRESAVSRLRNTARTILRKYSYPTSGREEVIVSVIEALRSSSN
jgi:hypothetical protein